MQFFSLFIAILVTAIWGFNFVVIKYCLSTISPLMLCLLRFLLASVPFIFFIKPPKTSPQLVVLYGIIMFALQFSLIFLGMELGVEAGLASLLLQTQVFFSLFMGVFLLGERLRSWHVLGCTSAFLGIGIVIGHLETDVNFIGLFPILGGALCSSTGNYISKKIGIVNSFSLVIWGSLVACPFTLLAAFAFEGTDAILLTLQTLDRNALLGVLFITFLSTIFGYSAWSWLIAHHPLRVITPFTLLVPVFAIVSSYFFLGEELEPWKLIAAGCILFGLTLNLFGHHILRIRVPFD